MRPERNGQGGNAWWMPTCLPEMPRVLPSWKNNSGDNLASTFSINVVETRLLPLPVFLANQEVRESMNWGMDKQMLVIRSVGYYSAIKMEFSTGTWYNADEPRKHAAEWKKPDILHDCIDRKCLEEVNHRNRKLITGDSSWVLGFPFRMMKMFWN